MSLENLFEKLDVDDLQDGSTNTISTREVQALPKGIFGTIVNGLKNVLRWMRGRNS